MAKRRPAYAKQFQPRPYPCTNWLRLGWAGFQLAGEEAKAGSRNVIALHPDLTPHEVDWSLLAGCSLVIVEHEDIGQDYRYQLIDALALAGVRDAYLIPSSKRLGDVCALNVRNQRVVA